MDDNQHAVGALCPVQGAALPTDSPLAGPLAVFYVVAMRALIFLAYIIELGIEEFLPTIPI